jgi:hypothetical protein
MSVAATFVVLSLVPFCAATNERGRAFLAGKAADPDVSTLRVRHLK